MTEMKNINGVSISAKDIPKYTWNADLIAFDGPFLSLFKSDEGIDALFAWVDCDTTRNRWVILEVSRDNLRDYLTQQITLFEVFKRTTSVVTFDIGVSGKRSNLVRTRWDSLPAEYLPAVDSYLKEEIATKDASKLAQEKPIRYSIKLDGELYLDDLAGIPKLYQQLYSFHYGLEHLGRAAIKSTISRLMHKWSGGFSAVNLFTGLRNVTPSIHRARLRQLQYNSPGHITLELLPEMAAKITAVVKHMEADGNFQTAEKLYKEIYSYFRTNGISGFEDERVSSNKNLTASQLKELGEFVDRFFTLLRWGCYKAEFADLDIGPLQQLRAILAYYRRLRNILGYVQRGMVEFT